MAPDGYDLAGRVAVVTAGGEGIGRATALLLARCGADIVIAGRTAATLERTAREIADATGRRCLGVPTDARDEAQVERLVVRTIETFGRIDILVNGVGWSVRAPLGRMTTEEWHGDLALNLDTAFYCARSVSAHMRRQGGGAIVSISSVAGIDGVAGMGAYSVAKSGLSMLTRIGAAEWGPHGIRVNCVAPGLVATQNASRELVAAGIDADSICAGRPLGRAGTAEDVASAIVFLASDAASYITGQTLMVDGGPLVGGAGD
jgi:NAD(P)-dependent dehydrogenase (short-subunit alcohol dehydrogenase family)